MIWIRFLPALVRTGAASADEDHSSASPSLSSSSSAMDGDNEDCSSTSGTLYSACCIAENSIDVPNSNNQESSCLSDARYDFPALPPTTLSLEINLPLACNSFCMTSNSSAPVPRTAHSKKTQSNPVSPAPYAGDKTSLEVQVNFKSATLRRTRSYLSYPSRAHPSSPIDVLSLSQITLPITCPVTKLSTDEVVVEPVSSSSDTFNCPFKISRSMHCFPCFSVDGECNNNL